MAAISKPPTLSRAAAREAFRLDNGEALWRTPEGQWGVVARGQTAPFVLNNQVVWEDVALEEDVELTADADGKVRRRGRLIDPGGQAWIVPAGVRARAIT